MNQRSQSWYCSATDSVDTVLSPASQRGGVSRHRPSRPAEGIFDFMDGGAEDEVTLRRNHAVFDSWGLMPSWGPVTGPDTTTTLLGRTAALPLTLTPTGATRLFHPEGELAVARAASEDGVPHVLRA